MSTALAIVALPVSAAVILGLLRSPVRRHLVAVPSLDRWHESSTPVFGGVGIFTGLSVGIWSAAAVGAFTVDRAFVGIYLAITLVFAAGLVDDIIGFSPIAKLAAQGGAAAIVLATGTHVQLIHSRPLGDAIAVLWLVGVANAFNLLDNMDGLAASIAAIAFAFFAVDAVTVHPNHTTLAFGLAGSLACAGFLPFNFRLSGKALVFMGDAGSQALGFALASLGLVSSWRVAGSTIATLLLPILILAVPLLDTALVTVVRLAEGRPISQGGRDHSSHRLVHFGLSEKRAVGLLALIALSIGGSSLAYNVLDNPRYTVVGVVLTFALLLQFASFLADVERRPVDLEPFGIGEAVAIHWRRLAEVLVDFGIVFGSAVAAYVLVMGWPGTTSQRFIAGLTLPVLLTARYLAFFPFGLYRSIWRYAGGRDIAAIATAVVLSELVVLSFMVLTQNMRDFHRSFFILDALICTVGIAASRFVERAVIPGSLSFRDRTLRRTLIVGAGRTGRSLMRELRESPGERVVGFLDDNPRLRRRRIHGIPVLGGTDELARALERSEPDIVLVTIPNAPKERLDAIVSGCADAAIECRFVRRELDLDPRVILGATAD